MICIIKNFICNYLCAIIYIFKCIIYTGLVSRGNFGEALAEEMPVKILSNNIHVRAQTLKYPV